MISNQHKWSMVQLKSSEGGPAVALPEMGEKCMAIQFVVHGTALYYFLQSDKGGMSELVRAKFWNDFYKVLIDHFTNYTITEVLGF
jgi:hypothetical protein